MKLESCKWRSRLFQRGGRASVKDRSPGLVWVLGTAHVATLDVVTIEVGGGRGGRWWAGSRRHEGQRRRWYGPTSCFAAVRAITSYIRTLPICNGQLSIACWLIDYREWYETHWWCPLIRRVRRLGTCWLALLIISVDDTYAGERDYQHPVFLPGSQTNMEVTAVHRRLVQISASNRSR